MFHLVGKSICLEIFKHHPDFREVSVWLWKQTNNIGPAVYDFKLTKIKIILVTFM